MKRAWALIAAMGAALPLHAQDADQFTDSRYSITVQGYYLNVDDDRGANEGVGASLAAGGRVVGPLWIEVQAFHNELETRGFGADFYQSGGGLDLMLRFGNTEQFNVYVLGGGGGVYNDVVPDRLDETTFYANVGVGIATPTFGNAGFRLRGDARYIYDTFRQDFDDFRIGGGLEFPLGRTRIQQKIIERTVEREVIKEVPVERVVERTTEIIPPAPYVPPVRPADTDGDGVSDTNDRCPSTVPGAQTDDAGCIRAPQVVTLPNVTFHTASTELTEQGKGVLGTVVNFMRDQPDVAVEIAGHTDSQGEQSYNLDLSKGRAASVRNFLVQSGIDADRLTSQGYGEFEPVAPNDTEAGRAANRRVEFRIRTR